MNTDLIPAKSQSDNRNVETPKLDRAAFAAGVARYEFGARNYCDEDHDGFVDRRYEVHSGIPTTHILKHVGNKPWADPVRVPERPRHPVRRESGADNTTIRSNDNSANAVSTLGRAARAKAPERFEPGEDEYAEPLLSVLMGERVDDSPSTAP